MPEPARAFNPISAALRRVTHRLRKEMTDGRRSNVIDTDAILGVLDAVAIELESCDEIRNLVNAIADDTETDPPPPPNRTPVSDPSRRPTPPPSPPAPNPERGGRRQTPQ